MNTKLRLLVLLLILSLFTFVLSGLGAAKQQRPENPLKHIKARTEKGSNVGNRIRQLRAANNSVHMALEAFEKRGHGLRSMRRFQSEVGSTAQAKSHTKQDRSVREKPTTHLSKRRLPATELR